MRWSLVKNLLLGLLLVMNLYMLGVSFAKRLSSEKIPPLVAASAVEALENSGISCDPGLFPDRYLTVRTFNVSFPTPMELSRMFFGEQLAFQTEERTLIARQDGAELRVEDEGFSYSSGEAASSANEKQLRRALKELGLDMSRARYARDGSFACYFDGRPVFGMYIRASLDADGQLARVEARWPLKGYTGDRRSGVSIIDFIPDILSRFPEGGTVTGLEAGYLAVRNENTDIYSFVPAWRITMEDGKTEVFS